MPWLITLSCPHTAISCLARYEQSLGRPAAAIATLRARLKEQPSSTASEKSKGVWHAVVAAYRERGWAHWAAITEEAAHTQKLNTAKPPL